MCFRCRNLFPPTKLSTLPSCGCGQVALRSLFSSWLTFRSVQRREISGHDNHLFPDCQDSNVPTTLNLIVVPVRRAKPNWTNMCEIDKSLTSARERGTDEPGGPEARRPGWMFHQPRTDGGVLGAGFPATVGLHAALSARIPIRWPPEVLWAKDVRTIRPR